MASNQSTLKDIKMIYSIHSRMDYKNLEEIGRVCNKLIEKDVLTSEIGSKYVKKLSDIMLEEDNGECIFCQKIDLSNPAICNDCAKKISVKFNMPLAMSGKTIENAPEETAIEETTIEETAAEGTTIEETAAEETTIEETAPEKTTIEETAISEAAIEEAPTKAAVEDIASKAAGNEEIPVDIGNPDTDIDYSMDIEFLELAAAMEAISDEEDAAQLAMFSEMDASDEGQITAQKTIKDNDEGPGSFMESLAAMQAENAQEPKKKSKGVLSRLFNKKTGTNKDKKMKIDFNVPPYTDNELEYLKQSIESHTISGDNSFTKKCNEWMEKRFDAKKVLLTTSGSTALDMAALMCDFKPGDEVILPSYTFSSTANSFVLAGAKLVFVDIRPDTMNIDESKIERAITDKTKVIVAMHYAGVACEMDTIMDIAKRHNLMVVEDAAQAVMSKYKGKALGTIGDFGCYSFHETKNYSMGEGGALVINNEDFIERAEILREKGTNRSKFYRGQVDKYTWVDFGDSYLPSDINAAYLWPQLLIADEINNDRLSSWNRYYEGLRDLGDAGLIELPTVPEGCVHNAHMFYIKLKDLGTRSAFIKFMKEDQIGCVFHYVPLHSAPAGLKFGRFDGEDEYTTRESDRLVRLPMHYRLSADNVDRIIKRVHEFFQ